MQETGDKISYPLSILVRNTEEFKHIVCPNDLLKYLKSIGKNNAVRICLNSIAYYLERTYRT